MLGLLDLEEHLKKPERAELEGGWRLSPVKAVFISHVSIIVSWVGTISYTIPQDPSSSGMPWEHIKKKR